MSIEKNNTNPGVFDKKKMLDELAIDIANRFGINKENAKKLIQKNTLKGIDSLKKEITEINSDNLTNIKNEELEKLFFTLKGALDVIEKSSKIEIKTLKEDIEKSINIEDFKRDIEKYLPAKLIEKAKNPQNPHEHILGFALGTANSIMVTADILYQIGKGILKSPYDLYMIVSGKGESDSFKNI